jgi:Holliday junction resolvasome RuvABC endonuclease subunit
MIVLGVDPGYRNLGLSVVLIAEDGTKAKVLHSRSMSVGNATAPMAFTKFLWPVLEELNQRFTIDAIASETPPIIVGQIKTTAYLWAVSSIIVAWAHSKGAAFRHASPMSLKMAVCRGLGREWDRKDIPKKSEVKRLIQLLLGDASATSHENDATLAALTMFSKLIPDS